MPLRNAAQAVQLITFALVGGLIGWLIESLHRAKRQAEEAQREMTQRAGEAEEGRRTLETLMEYIPEGITIAEDPDVRIRRVSRYGQQLTGRSREVIEGIPEEEHVEKWDIYRAGGVTRPSGDELPLTRVIRQGEIIQDEEWVLRRPDGAAVPILCNTGPIRDLEGRIVGGIIAWRDITERKRIEAEHEQLHQEVERQRHLLQSVLDTAPVGIVVLDGQELRVKLDNPAYRQSLEEPYRSTGTVGMHPGEFIPGAEKSGLIDRFRRVAATGEPYHDPEYEHFGFARGVTYWRWSLLPLAAEGQAVPDLLLLVVEITEQVRARKQIEELAERLAEERAFLEAVVQQMPAGIILAEPSGRIVLSNEQVSQIFRHPCLPSENIQEYGEWRGFHPDGRPYRPEEWPMARSLLTGEVVTGEEIGILRGDGTRGTIWNYSAPIRDREGRIIAGVVSFQDITERKQMEMALRETNRHKDEFLAMLAHELRNPLAAISSAVQLLRIRGIADPVLQQVQEVAARQVQHMSHMLDDLLDVSRITRGKVTLKKKEIDLATVIQSAVEASRPDIQGKGHHLSVSLPPETLRVHGDPVRLTQVVSNLLNNAAKYTPAGGQIWLSVEPQGNEAQIRVRDNGMGIPADLLPRIFDLFVQGDCSLDRSQGGLGVGLTMARTLVEMHGGRVEAHSDGLGQGSEFVVWLGLAAEGSGKRAQGTDAQAPAPRRILVVDDNADAATMLAMLLQVEGHEVMAVHSGPAALELVGSYRPEVVLLDIGMPGMDGYEVARRLRQEPVLAGTLIVALTGYGQGEDQERSRAAGFDGHLVKPVEVTALRRVIAGVPANP